MIRVRKEEMEAFTESVLTALGATLEVAESVAESLVSADVRGHSSHGTIRLGTSYEEMIRDEHIVPDRTPTVDRDSGAMAIVDGRMGFGHVAGRLAVEVSVEKAAVHGIACVGIKNATHLGRIGEWAERAADEGMFFVAFVNSGGGSRTVAPVGSAHRRFSTNPLGFGVPTYDAYDFPIVLDMATSQVAHGKVTKRHIEDKPVPDEWTTDADGNPVTDATTFEKGTGAMLPLGGRTAGYKGFGLAMMAELFSGIIGGGMVAGQRPPGSVNNAAAFLTIDPTWFRSTEEITNTITDLVEFIRATEFSKDVPLGNGARGERGQMPGEPEHETAEDRLANGIPYDPRTAELLTDVAERYGLADAVPFDD